MPDSHLFVGEKVVEEYGQPSRSVSVRRLVYDAKGKLLFDTTWYSSYLAEPKVVRYGTKPVPVGVDHDEADAHGHDDDRYDDLERHDDALAAFDFGDPFGQPGRHPRRAQRRRVDAGVARPAFGDLRLRLVQPLHHVLEAEPRPAQMRHARVDP